MNFDLDRLQHMNVLDQDGEKIGSVGQIYLDDETGRASFVTVKTGLFGTKETFVPLDGAGEDGDDLRVPYTKDFVKDAPNVDADGHLSEQEQDAIQDYYRGQGVGRGDLRGDLRDDRRDEFVGNSTDLTDRTDLDARREGDVEAAMPVAGGADRNFDERRGNLEGDRHTDGDTDSMVRREEELRVGKERVETGRVRLRKHVVTEQKTITVPVEREEFEVVREPIAEGTTSQGELGDDEASITLSEERPVVDKVVVDKERVGLQTNTVQDDREVQAEVGREEIEVDLEGGVDRDGRIDRNDR